MNRKHKAKLKKKVVPPSSVEHPYNNLDDWLGANFSKPPASEKWIKAFQRRIDDAFGDKGMFVLAWSGDQKYWCDEFYTDWFSTGEPKPNSLEKKPMLLWKTFPVNDFDYIYVYPPRWVILEKWHPAQYAPNWEAEGRVADKTMLGNSKRIRPKKPPKEFWGFWKTVAQHDEPIIEGAKPECCAISEETKMMCYGKYRLPNDKDLDALRRMRKDMDKRKAQRPDEPLTQRSLREARANSQYFREQATRQKAKAGHDEALAVPDMFLGNLDERGIKLSLREKQEILKEAFTLNEEQALKEANL